MAVTKQLKLLRLSFTALALLCVLALVLGPTVLTYSASNQRVLADDTSNMTAVPGYVNSRDLCNGWYPDVCPVPANSTEYQDRLAWLTEELAKVQVPIKYDIWTKRVVCGPTDSNCVPYAPTAYYFSAGTGLSYETDIRSIVRGTEALRIALMQHAGKDKSAITLVWYPGYEARHPSSGNPIGAPWPDHPYAANGWKMFHPSAEDNNVQWPASAQFISGQRRWVKWMRVVQPGCGPFGTPTPACPIKVEYAWEETSLR